VATKEHKRHVRELIEALESRVHVGPPIHSAEILSLREFLRQSEFSPASDYFSRLTQLQHRLHSRIEQPITTQGKRNYGGEAAGYWMQLQSAYDHVILSTCYEGEFNLKRGRVKVSCRFNQAGRIDFVEAKLLRSLHPLLNGAIRKLLTVKDFPKNRKDWFEAEAFVLEVLPQELVFLYQDIFRCQRDEILAWLINIGHRLVTDLNSHLQSRRDTGSQSDRNPDQLPLQALRTDRVALPILDKAALLQAAVEVIDPKNVVIRYSEG
jgi:hypothetical protein